VAPTLADALSDMLNLAGSNGHLDAAKWLREQGAAWPQMLCAGFHEWSGPALVWAREEGCISPVALVNGPFDDPFEVMLAEFPPAPAGAAAGAAAAAAAGDFHLFDELDAVGTSPPVMDMVSAHLPLSALPPDHERVQR
jgi:hypothetical protein